jgi:membrane complex biogenesis BtpA family protein
VSKLLMELFGVPKPVIAMAHFPALPGTPRYDPVLGIEGIFDRVSADVKSLVQGGVDAIMFCNEDDRPYSLQAGFEAVSVMTSVITQVRPSDRAFGVDFLWDAKAPLAIAKATGAVFIRQVVTGVYESDMGLWAPNAASIFRYRRQIDAEDVHIFANITPEFASPLGNRSVANRAHSAVVSTLVDAILIAGPMAGAEPEIQAVRDAKKSAGDSVPILLNTGARPDNICQFLSIADGVIVGSSLKVDGYTWNPVDPARVKAFMAKVHEAREEAGWAKKAL